MTNDLHTFFLHLFLLLYLKKKISIRTSGTGHFFKRGDEKGFFYFNLIELIVIYNLIKN